MLFAAVTLAAGPVHADVFTYKCKAGGRSLYAKIDTSANTFQWRGKSYKIVEEPDCAKYGWTVKGNGRSFEACTATQGYLDFKDEGGKTAVCDLQ